jgi:hypothetical protein
MESLFNTHWPTAIHNSYLQTEQLPVTNKNIPTIKTKYAYDAKQLNSGEIPSRTVYSAAGRAGKQHRYKGSRQTKLFSLAFYSTDISLGKNCLK